MKNKKSRHFNMLEVILAITVIGAGLTLLLVLFPVATRAAAETVDNNYVPMVANNFITYAKANIDFDPSWLATLPEPGILEKLPAIPNIDEIVGTHGDFDITHIKDGGTSPKQENQEPLSLYECNYGGINNGFCAVVRGGLDNGRYTLVDFTAYVKLERANSDNFKTGSGESEILYYAFPKWSTKVSTPEDAMSNPNFTDNFARVILTVSWPLEVPPAARKSRVFIIEKARLK